MSALVTRADLQRARAVLDGVAVRLPLLRLADREHPLLLKPENLQPTGSFKLRGAFHHVASLDGAVRAAGVVAHSSGNHAQAVAHAARVFGVPCTVVMPDTAARVKTAAVRALGAEVILVPAGEYRSTAESLAAGLGRALVPPYDDLHVIAGQGTVGLEIVEDLPADATVIVPVGGGGLLSGVAAAVKLLRPACRVVGAEPALAGDAAVSFRTGRLVAWTAAETARTAADGLRTPALGALTWRHVRAYADGIITVTEEEIRRATAFLAARARMVAEPSGAVATAAYLFHRAELPPADTYVAVVSGGNIHPEDLRAVLAAETC
ncbi:threonine ammonia-lyase [Streptomyces sp. HB2AG]|uniref:threonine ammonia-lyase n=1 Tax=Streptomyces sp. HB2AG TaxID=2983400 RepID=UPI0022AAC04F|nr:threonine/serine dehydratase [Streptomyces sp. HB2AG]MCZ2524800.1 threonine/serine dehydratase [Streptomyces sp. HB2AG]